VVKWSFDGFLKTSVHFKILSFTIGFTYINFTAAIHAHHHIANILEDHQNRIEKACSAMLRKWLDMGSSPTWGTLDEAIDKIMKEKKSTTLSKGDCTDGGGMWALVKLYSFIGCT